MAKTSIEWTDETWNCVTGCDRVSEGCRSCYALTLAKRLKAMGNPRYQRDGKPPTSGPGFGVTMHPDKLTDPLTWTKPRRVFVNSMSDLFHAEVTEPFIDLVFAAMLLSPQHTFQILTKRPQRMYRYLSNEYIRGRVLMAVDVLLARPGFERQRQEAKYELIGNRLLKSWPLANCWIGTSVENQDAAYRIDWLVKTPAAVRFISAEPLLGPLDLSRWLRTWPVIEATSAFGGEIAHGAGPLVDWLITGGESGPSARPCDPDWVRSIRDQCVAAGVAYFHKQWGGIRPKSGGRLLDGREWSEFPVAEIGDQPGVPA